MNHNYIGWPIFLLEKNVIYRATNFMFKLVRSYSTFVVSNCSMSPQHRSLALALMAVHTYCFSVN